ncbi:hypothetical protein ACQPZ8_28385 [Actinomadura nitritigenes]|uniref:hypothetical protein n=1 Tax=Actinomadura nitritigenes TaxID=134602 RepID=UPI003D8DE386
MRIDGTQYGVRGKDGVFILVHEPSSEVVGAFYAEEDEPGWWRGAAWGHVRRFFIPGAEPVDIAVRFLR